MFKIDVNRSDLLDAWVARTSPRLPFLEADEVRASLDAVVDSIQTGLSAGDDYADPAWDETRFVIQDLARSWREISSSAHLSGVLRDLGYALDDVNQGDDAYDATLKHDLVDQLVLWALEARVDRLNELVEQQRAEMAEISTPFIEVFKGVAVLPLIGTLDSQRAERVMETLLHGIDRHNTKVVVLDITGVPRVDAFVAERIAKSVAAARMMGTHTILSGLGPDIALTMVRVGVDLTLVESTARLSDALERALKRLGLGIQQLRTADQQR